MQSSASGSRKDHARTRSAISGPPDLLAGAAIGARHGDGVGDGAGAHRAGVDRLGIKVFSPTSMVLGWNPAGRREHREH
jgi:hypothetical protein